MINTETIMFLIIFKVVGVPLNGSLTVILLSTLLFVMSYQAIAVFIVSLLSNLCLLYTSLALSLPWINRRTDRRPANRFRTRPASSSCVN